MSVRTFRLNEVVTPLDANDQSRIIPRKSNMTMRIKHLVEDTDWDQEILKGEKWVDLFCWSLLGSSTLYFGVVCLKMLVR